MIDGPIWNLKKSPRGLLKKTNMINCNPAFKKEMSKWNKNSRIVIMTDLINIGHMSFGTSVAKTIWDIGSCGTFQLIRMIRTTHPFWPCGAFRSETICLCMTPRVAVLVHSMVYSRQSRQAVLSYSQSGHRPVQFQPATTHTTWFRQAPPTGTKSTVTRLSFSLSCMGHRN